MDLSKLTDKELAYVKRLVISASVLPCPPSQQLRRKKMLLGEQEENYAVYRCALRFNVVDLQRSR